jgi:hypothetical protein
MASFTLIIISGRTAYKHITLQLAMQSSPNTLTVLQIDLVGVNRIANPIRVIFLLR